MNLFFYFFCRFSKLLKWKKKKKRLLFDYLIKFLCGLIWGSTLQCLIWNQKVKMRLCFSSPEKVPEFVKKHNQDPVSFYHFERDKRTKWSLSSELKTNQREWEQRKRNSLMKKEQWVEMCLLMTEHSSCPTSKQWMFSKKCGKHMIQIKTDFWQNK